MIGNKKNKGFALLYAVIVISLITVVAFAVSRTALRETSFSLLGKQSQQAFYAANSGIECATYADVRFAIFPSIFLENGSGFEVQCANEILSPVLVYDEYATSTKSDVKISEFTINNINESDACAVVSVEKSHSSGPSGVLSTKITSKGYNTCSGSNRVERTISVSY